MIEMVELIFDLVENILGTGENIASTLSFSNNVFFFPKAVFYGFWKLWSVAQGYTSK